MAADQNQMMAAQAMMARIAAAQQMMQQQQQQQQGGGAGGANPAADKMAAAQAFMAQMMAAHQQGGAGGHAGGGGTPAMLPQQQMMMQQLLMRQAAAAAAASGPDQGQHGASDSQGLNQAGPPSCAGKGLEMMQQEALGHGHSHGGGGGHGHSHGGGGGHGHSHGGGGGSGGGHGHSHGGNKDMVDEQMLMSLHAQMAFMQSKHKQDNLSKGYILQDPNASQGPRESYLQGGGHYTPPIFGWGPLAKGFVDPQKIQQDHSEGKAPAANMQEKLSMMVSGSAGSPLNNVWLFTLPLLGRLRVVKDKLGLMQASFVLFYWIYGNYTTWNIILLPQYFDGHMSVILMLYYAIISGLCLTSFLRAFTTSPGVTPLPMMGLVDDTWTFCDVCQKQRPAKAHHCRRCGQCVPVMDHHCPWINNCVGEGNQWLFMQLVAYAHILSLSTLVLDLLYMFYMKPCVSCDPTSFAIRHQHGMINVCTVMAILMTMGGAGLYCTQHISVLFSSFAIFNAKGLIWIAIGMAVLMTMAGFGLFFTQHTNAMSDTTTLDWMKMQQNFHMQGKFMNWNDMPKQTRSFSEAYSRVCGLGPWWLWPFPCRRRRPVLTRPRESV